MDMSTGDPTPRWKQRFANYERALARLEDGAERVRAERADDFLQSALIQTFEYTWELAWKTLGDLLKAHGVKLKTFTPLTVVREAFKADLITDGQEWIAMMEDRNLSSHVYDAEVMSQISERILSQHVQRLRTLATRLADEGAD